MMRMGKSASQIKLTMKNIGCTHGVEIDERDLYMLISELKNRDIRYKVIQNDLS